MDSELKQRWKSCLDNVMLRGVSHACSLTVVHFRIRTLCQKDERVTEATVLWRPSIHPIQGHALDDLAGWIREHHRMGIVLQRQEKGPRDRVFSGKVAGQTQLIVTDKAGCRLRRG